MPLIRASIRRMLEIGDSNRQKNVFVRIRELVSGQKAAGTIFDTFIEKNTNRAWYGFFDNGIGKQEVEILYCTDMVAPDTS